MSQTEVDIANRALVRLGLKEIPDSYSTFSAAINGGDTQSSTEVLNRHFDDWKRELLRIHPWNFAVRRKTLINPYATAPFSLKIRNFIVGNSVVPGSSYNESDAAAKLNNPVAVQVIPEELESIGSWDRWDHNISNGDVIKLIDTPYPSLNDKYYYVSRGWNDGSLVGAYRSGGTLTNEWTALSLYTRLGEGVSGASFIGTTPSDSAGDTSGYSLDGSSIVYTEEYPTDKYNVGSIVRENKSEWDYQYVLPYTCIRLLQVEDLALDKQYVLEKMNNSPGFKYPSMAILCNTSEKINIRFVEDISFSGTDPVDPTFTECLSLKVALKLSEKFLKTTSASEVIKSEYMDSLSLAKSIDAQEASSVQNFHSTWADEMGRST